MQRDFIAYSPTGAQVRFAMVGAAALICFCQGTISPLRDDNIVLWKRKVFRHRGSYKAERFPVSSSTDSDHRPSLLIGDSLKPFLDFVPKYEIY